MGLNKQYNGYQSFQYLEPGTDYRTFEFYESPTAWVEPYVVPVTAAEEARVQEILRQNVVISLHDHPFEIPKRAEELFALNREGRSFTCYEALSRSGLDCVWDNLMDGTACISSKMGWKWEDVIYDLGMRLCDIAHQDLLIRCERVSDVHRAYQEGKIAWLPVLEAATPIENEVDRLDVLYGLGIRSIGLTYSEANALGSGLAEKRDGGLTALGRKAIARMNKLGLIIDVAHVGDQTTLEAIEVSEQPVICSHSGARAVWNTSRMKPDNVLLAIAQSGGVIGIEASPNTSRTRAEGPHTIEDVMQHFEYCVRLLGIDYVAFGPDTMYGDHVGLHRAFAEHLSISTITGGRHAEEDQPQYVVGMENPTECFPNIVRWLVSHGYGDEEIAKVIGGNVLRVMKAVWG